jgi:spore maturation protein CgeB
MLIDKDLLGDAFFHVVEQGDETMYGFNESTGRTYYTIPLAADKTISSVVPQKKFDCDVSYVGTNLPDKRQFFKNHMFPLRRNFDVKVYGQDWTRTDSAIGWIQRFGQFFNVPLLSKIRRPKLSIEDEASIYASSKISVNVHEAFQRRFGGDCNERTFKIPMCGGFEVVDNVECIKKYFKPGVELAIAENDSEWVEMVYYYLKNPDLRNDMVQRGKAKVLKDHTYHNRVNDIISLYNKRRLQ